jgi:hypothetical protein
MRDYYTSNSHQIDSSLLNRLEYETDVHYVKKYGDFYDILFVDSSGFVFHSIKHEADYHTNLFNGKYSDTQLAKHIRNNPDREFVDYDFYPPSDEPAAFFVIPIHGSESLQGWFVLQFPINKINAILSDHKELGMTGEVYLVNKNRLMLTDSRFIEDSTILKLQVDTEAVRSALMQKSDNMIIKDYRGVRVFSTFEQFDMFNNSWIIIVEIDEDEVITNHYLKYKKYYLSKIVNQNSRSSQIMLANLDRNESIRIGKRVDMNEFCMAKSGELLQTKGAGPCTAIIISYPGKFGYLAHISPTDVIYDSSLITKYLSWGKSNFLEKIVQHIQHYDIYPYQQKDIQFVIIATHNKSIGNVIDRLCSVGVHLEQIKYLCNPSAYYANVSFDQSNDSIYIEWVTKDDQRTAYHKKVSDIESIDLLVKNMLDIN